MTAGHDGAMKKTKSLYHGHRFPAGVISYGSHPAKMRGRAVEIVAAVAGRHGLLTMRRLITRGGAAQRRAMTH